MKQNLLSKNEKKVLEMIEENPLVTQMEMADAIGISRSTIATVISALTQKKYLLGRAYLVNRSNGVFCIGAMNVDRKYTLQKDIMYQTSNPVTSSSSVGGVARNIAENLGRLQIDTSLISLGGFDQDFQYIKKETEPFVNMQHVTQKTEATTGAYSAILDGHGEMELAIADMQIHDEMHLEWIKAYQNVLSQARLIVLDLNLPQETVAYVLSLAQQYEIELFIIPVSGPKMNRLPQDLFGVTWLIVNQDESETFFEEKVENDGDFERLADQWLALGVKNVVVTRGSKSSIYGNQNGKRQSFQPPKVEEVVDVTGAGDAYASGVIYGHLKGFAPEESIHLGMANSYATIQSTHTVQADLTAKKLQKKANILFKKEQNLS